MRFNLAAMVTSALTAAVLLAGCSSDPDTDATANANSNATEPAGTTPASPTSSTSSAAPAPTPTPDPTPARPPDGPASNCLFTVAQVSRVLGGGWTRTPAAGQPCTYSSDRGAVAVSQVVAGEIEKGLSDARAACVDGVEPVTLRRGRLLICVERNDQVGQVVVGNVVSRDQLWLVLIPAPADGVPAPQLEAMLALMQGVPG